MSTSIRTTLTALALLTLLPVQTSSAQTQPARSARLQEVVNKAVEHTLEKFAAQKLGPDQLAVTLVDMRDPQQLAQGSYRGGEQIYPASVIKLFYMVAAHQWMEDGKLKDTAELRRAMRDMIVDSLNEATGYLVDLLTGTTSGPELGPKQIEQWYFKRNAVNRYFASLSYTNINVNRKPWCEGPYGREMQSVQLHKPNHRNWLTTDATARLLTGIVTGQTVSAARCAEMMELLKRDPTPGSGNKNDQAHAYTALGLPPGAKLWSKAGWTSATRHDAAYVELPNGSKFILVTFTVDHASERDIIATVAKAVVESLPAPAPAAK
ncbi:MAG TPA: serine hydrolase [Candidatus Paceibacterota bacterium]|nr:serine hydrolase [Verrucomicrobiota bacterium]HSA09391.1 serine hydrolase [Candidatus Paceibacterota bacterium]